jgi:signal transduction histidine kinase
MKVRARRARLIVMDDVTERGIEWRGVRSIWAALAMMCALTVTIIWAATGGAFWPVWVWLGLSAPFMFRSAVTAALSSPRRWRPLALQAAVSGVAATIVTIVWGLTGFGFWLFWPLFGLAFALGVHGVLVGMWHSLRPGEREQQLEQRVDVLTRTRRGALDVQSAELRRIERDLHDGAQARLVALSMQLGRAEVRVEDDPEVAALLRNARAEATAAITELRDLARGIAPPVLSDRGLVAAVTALGDRSALDVEVEAQIARRLPPVVESAAYFVVAEALTNAAKHARGASARVRLSDAGARLVVSIADDGPGGAVPTGNGGLTGLRHRVEALDGTLEVRSPLGVGTTIRAELPCE